MNVRRRVLDFGAFPRWSRARHLRRVERVPYPKGDLARDELYRYFIQRHQGELKPRPSMLDQALHPNSVRHECCQGRWHRASGLVVRVEISGLAAKDGGWQLPGWHLLPEDNASVAVVLDLGAHR